MSETETLPPPRPRPLSPHLGHYRLPLSALTSIMHRASGVALTGGAFVLAAWLWATATNAECFATLQNLLSSKLGLVALFGWSLALYYHLCAGIRHLVWDAGFGFEKPEFKATNVMIILAALILTGGTWYFVWPSIAPLIGT